MRHPTVSTTTHVHLQDEPISVEEAVYHGDGRWGLLVGGELQVHGTRAQLFAFFGAGIKVTESLAGGSVEGFDEPNLLDRCGPSCRPDGHADALADAAAGARVEAMERGHD